MKKTVSVFLAFLLLLTVPVFAASGKLSAASVKGDVGDTVTVKLHLDNPGIVAMRISIRYDSQVLKLVGAENGDVFAKNKAEFCPDLNADPFIVYWLDELSRNNNTTSGTLCELQFKILKGTESGRTIVHFDVYEDDTFDWELNNVPVSDCSCTVQVSTAGAATTATSSGTPTTSKAGTPTTTQAGTPTTTKAGTPTTTKAGMLTATKAAAGETGKPGVTAVTQSSTTKSGTGSDALTTQSVDSTAKTGTTAAIGDATAAATKSGDTPAPQTNADEDVPVDASVAEALPESADIQDETAAQQAEEKTVPETQAHTEDVQTTGETKDNSRSLLWLLLLIPVAAVAVVLIIKKKKSTK